ncbi:tetratricopeptide repeat protein [bacterium]|nr:tetratricopeptide repeat protein [bacterium]RQV95982.1 MAG: hypothetical protein EH221_05380 [bacterium]
MKREFFQQIILILFLFMLLGCAYFNTFYNAKRYYTMAYNDTMNNATKKPTAQALQNYQLAIDKGLKLIELYPDSKWVDDALLLLGKSYYYREEYFQSRNFLLELMTHHSQSELISDAEFWMAKTDLALNNYSAAEERFHHILEKEIPDKLREELYYSLGNVFEERGDFKNAVNAYQMSLDVGMEVLKTEALFAIAMNYDTMGIYDRAAEFFQRVIDTDPIPETLYQARFKYAEMMKKLKHYDEAIALFEVLLGGETNTSKIVRLNFEIAECLALLGDIDGAITVYQDVIQKWKRTAYSARAYYALGRLYEQHREDYDRALDNYNQVKLELPRSAYADSAAVLGRDIQRLQALQQVVEAGIMGEKGELILTREEIEEDSLQLGQVYTKMDTLSDSRDARYQLMVELGGKLFADSVKYEYEELERRGQYLNHTMAADQQTVNWCAWFGEGIVPSYSALEFEFPKLRDRMEDYVQRMAENPELKSFLVEETDKNLFLLGELYLFRFSKPDMAIDQYHLILNQFPESAYAPQALYNLCFIMNDVYLDTAKADSCFRELIERYPETTFANIVRAHLGFESIVTREDSIQHIFTLAENSLLIENNPQKAIKQYGMILERFPNSVYAPQAAYTMGWIYENQLDSLNRAYVFYSDLLKNYPETPYAQQVKEKVRAVEMENQRQTEAIESKNESTEVIEETIQSQQLEVP